MVVVTVKPRLAILPVLQASFDRSLAIIADHQCNTLPFQTSSGSFEGYGMLAEVDTDDMLQIVADPLVEWLSSPTRYLGPSWLRLLECFKSKTAPQKEVRNESRDRVGSSLLGMLFGVLQAKHLTTLKHSTTELNKPNMRFRVFFQEKLKLELARKGSKSITSNVRGLCVCVAKVASRASASRRVH